MAPILSGKRIMLGISGGIAAYKSVTLASRFTQANALVDVIMTHSAAKFVAPVTFQAITQRSVGDRHFRVLARRRAAAYRSRGPGARGRPVHHRAGHGSHDRPPRPGTERRNC